MADLRYQTQAQGQVGARAEIDQGLRSYMLGVYNYMALGVALDGDHRHGGGREPGGHCGASIR